jgi:hypothetical protein
MPAFNYCRELQPTVSSEKIATSALPSSHRGGNKNLFVIFFDQSYLMSPILLVYDLVTTMKIEGESYALLIALRTHSDDVALAVRSYDIANNAIRPISVASQHKREVQGLKRGRVLNTRLARGWYDHMPTMFGELAQGVSG